MSDYRLDIAHPRARAAQDSHRARSAAMAIPEAAALDVAYGDDPRQRYDVFPAGASSPALVFFHGGYWTAGDKEGRRFPAGAWAARGVAWITVEYRLCPAHRLEDLVDDARAAVRHIRHNAARYGIDPEHIHLTGNSAGGHLAAMAAAAEPCASLAAVSGLYDLLPLMAEDCQDWLGLTEARARALSPVAGLPPRGMPVLLAHGGDELPGFFRQTGLYAEALRGQGSAVEVIEVPGADHFEVIAEYARPQGAFFRALDARVTGATPA